MAGIGIIWRCLHSHAWQSVLAVGWDLAVLSAGTLTQDLSVVSLHGLVGLPHSMAAGSQERVTQENQEGALSPLST